MSPAAPSSEFTPIPSFTTVPPAAVTTSATVPTTVDAVGVLVASAGEVPDALGTDRATLTGAGFTAAVGATLPLPATDQVLRVAVGLGDAGALDAVAVRDAAAAFGRATSAHPRLALVVGDLGSLPAGEAAQAIVEGILLARYQYDVLRRAPKATPLAELTLVCDDGSADAVTTGAARGQSFARATMLARDLANSPHSHLSATTLADLAGDLAPETGLTVEVFGKEQLVAMGCGGLLGVNAGSTEPPRMIKLSYRPTAEPSGHLALVGKGIMYDSGGLSLKPGDEVHAQMKNDMSGAAAVFAAMATLATVDCPTAVTAWLMCTDNMPSGTAMALGDVITIRGGTTVEVVNTDAEGRLVMADALVLATEDGADAIVDIATLTGACMRALGTKVAGVMGNHQALIEQVRRAADATDEPVWPLPLEQRYRPDIASTVADIKNLGTANGGAIHAALFLAEFVGDVPWAHIDIAGTAQTPADVLWHTAGCSGFGARLLVQLALDFEVPAA
jgi:leucyl aminopeptidase